MDRADVTNANSFAKYCQQILGTPYAVSDLPKVGRNFKLIKQQYPKFTWQDTVHIVEFAKAQKIRPYSAHWVLGLYRRAWSKGYLAVLDEPQTDETVEEGIRHALSIEPDEFWRDRLMLCVDPYRGEVLEEWRKTRQPLFRFQ